LSHTSLEQLIDVLGYPRMISGYPLTSRHRWACGPDHVAALISLCGKRSLIRKSIVQSGSRAGRI